uniref:Uncharacterized protein n=1 Tax=Romanomermis culicivorax TaxID=13658 RepID=A0A915JHT4_ROMCU
MVQEVEMPTLEDQKNAETYVDEKSDDFKSKRDKHYKNEFSAAQGALKFAAMEDKSDAQPSKKTPQSELQNTDKSDREKANPDREEDEK